MTKYYSMRIIPITLIATLSLLLFGCSSEPSTWSITDVDATGWRQGESAVVELENRDSDAVQDVDFMFRLTGDFDQEYFIIKVGTLAPDSSLFEEELAVRVRRDREGDRHNEITVPYRSTVRLDQKGDYKFLLSPAKETIKGVEAVGVRLTSFK